MINRRGFTLVELVVVIVVVIIIITAAAIGANRYLQDERDTRRAANVATVSEELEKYYDNNGEYPGCNAITSPGSAVSKDVLIGIDQSALLVPYANDSTTNSIRCNETLTIDSDDFYEYKTETGANCQGAGSCGFYVLRYKSEYTKAILELESRRYGCCN